MVKHIVLFKLKNDISGAEKLAVMNQFKKTFQKKEELL